MQSSEGAYTIFETKQNNQSEDKHQGSVFHFMGHHVSSLAKEITHDHPILATK